jgi:endoglucanase Acf2
MVSRRDSKYMHLSKSLRSLWIVLLLTSGQVAIGQNVNVGLGSYSTSLPSGAVGPQSAAGQNIAPKVRSNFAQPIQTNDWWSSLIYPFYGDPHSNVLYAHPLNVKATSLGLEIGHTSDHVFAANDYLYPYEAHLIVGMVGFTAPSTTVSSYGDWTVQSVGQNGSRELQATMGHGLPYVFFRVFQGEAEIAPRGNASNVWHNQDEVLGITVDGKAYGVFAPAGSIWTESGTIRSSLNGKDYFSLALLPDTSPETLELFRSHAYAFVGNSVVEWDYNEATAELTTTYSYETQLMEDGGTNSSETLTALNRHQWLNTSDQLTDYTYESPQGILKLYEGNSFTTNLRFSGVLPALPDRGDYNRADLLELVQQAATETLPITPTYENGKAMGRFTSLVHIADQLGATEERDHFLSQIKLRLEDWFTAGGAQEYSYNDQWDVLTGYPSGFGADNQINDHHFHAAYAVMSAATVAQFDPTWALQENWGGMVNLLIKDANNWDRTDERFPFLRSHDAYAGHSWAAGHGDFGDGNNQESSSESMNFASAAILWGEATGQQEIRDMGVFLHATETTAVEQYWFDIDNEVFPADYPYVAIGMVWGGKGVHSTWFGADPEFIHGINILPVTAGSFYLGRHPEYVRANYEEIVFERSGQPNVWKDVLWEYLALSDPNLALSYYFADPGYEPFDGESRAHTLHWLYNLKKMGHADTTVTADVATYSVFRDQADDVTYIAYNAGSTERLVTFSDGYTLTVAPRSTNSGSTAVIDPDAPVALLQASRTSGKVPLTIAFEASRSFDPNGNDLAFAWDFAGQGASARADTSFTFTSTGDHWVRLSVTNSLTLVAQDSVRITVLGNGTPYSGSPASVPGRIQAENFDLGGEGVAYHDSDANNVGLAYRPGEGVDMENSGVGVDVYWITAGEWLEYTITVPEAGNYNFSPSVATVPGFGNFTLSIDGVDVSGTKPVFGTGAWTSWRPIPIPNVPLTAGQHIMRFDFNSDSDKTGWLFSMDFIDVARATGVGTENADLPTEFGLEQNYPNPFNPSTEINYSLPLAGQVRLEVFNTLGQKVSELVNAYQDAGTHRVSFDGGNLSTGLYLLRMTSGDLTLTRKMLLAK